MRMIFLERNADEVFPCARIGSRRWIRAVYAGNNGKREERYACTAGGKIKADYQ